MINKVASTFQVDHRVNCLSNCSLSPVCDSYNYRAADKTCQLNTSSVYPSQEILALKSSSKMCDVKPSLDRFPVNSYWNSLDQETVDVGSINSFKGRLDKIRKTRMGFFMDPAWSAKP